MFIADAGDLGSPVSIYLAVAGMGNIRICDFDSPDCPVCSYKEINKNQFFNKD